MNLGKKATTPSSDPKLKPTTLNPHAAEFVPFTLRSPSSSAGPTTTNNLDATTPRLLASSSSVLDRSESSASRHSDEEARQFWSHQLPDDITPDFKLMTTQDDTSYGASGSLSLAGLSLYDAENFPSPSGGGGGGGFVFSDQPHGHNLSDKSRYPISSFGEDQSFSPKPWDKQIMSAEKQLLGGNDDRERRNPFGRFMVSENPSIGEMEVNPVEFLASQFPGFAAESLAEVYFANGCDLQLTVEMLTQLELQVDNGMNQNMRPKIPAPAPAPNLTPMDFPALSISSTSPAQFDDMQQTGNHHYQSAGKDNMFFFKPDYVSAVKKLASQDTGLWKYEGNGSGDSSIGGSSRNFHAGSGRGPGRSIYSDKLSSNRAAPVAWLETGDAVGNLYSDLRGEARDYARLRNVYFEQV
ncbi:polyadenylate-binding protein-interacting protein 7 isoform X2 [Brassica napus]|uniref:polyadenylate-binding protein-interacting protein 7 isoform X2 n=1 Tax=Brassica napus TaxID=3708 RepID=UPI0020799D4C|nr:polyadenylate-binding protein-interacting protein 7 isoform X2 [Brassica napus]